MQKIKFDFEATKERIYAPNSNVPIGAPVDQNGNIANDGNAYGIVLCKETKNEKYWVRYNLVVMVAGYCDIIDAQAIWGDEYSAEAMAAMSDITFCDNHQLPTGGGGGGGGGESENWETIFTDEKHDEEITKIFVDKDNNGNPFSLKKIRIRLALKNAGTTYNFLYTGFNGSNRPYKPFTETAYPNSSASYYAGNLIYFDVESNFGYYVACADNAATANADAALGFEGGSIKKILLNKSDIAPQNITSFTTQPNVNHFTDYKIIIEGVRV